MKLDRAATMVATCVSMILTASAAGAEDETLYDPAPPPGAAFVRVINAGGEDVAATVEGTDFAAVAAGEASPYAIVADGTADLTVGGTEWSTPVERDAFHSVVVGAGAEPRLLTDEANGDRGRALVALYNLTHRPGLALKTADGSIEVITPTPPDATASRAVNPLSVAFGVFDGADMVAELPQADLRAGQAYAVIVTEPADAAVAHWVVSTTAPAP